MTLFRLAVEYIRKRNTQAMDGTPITPSVIRVANKVEKASLTSMLAGELLIKFTI